MKIVFIGGRDVHILGGIENYMYNLATQLVRMGHECIVYCESDHNGTETVNGFKVIYVKGPSSNLICKPWVSLKATLYTVFKEKNVDLIHYNAWPPSLWCWIARFAGIPSLMEGHGLEWQRSKYSPGARKIMKLMEALTAKMNRNLIMCSEAQVRYFKKTFNRDAVCIPTAINVPGKMADTGILEKYSLQKGKYFLFLGRLVQDKNPDYLIRAFKKCEVQGYKLVIAGNNDALPEYVAHLYGLAEGSDSIVFTGAVYGRDKETLLSNAFCFCLPSTIEGLSIALLEAMIHRLPIIASDIEANREVLSRNNALWVKPENEEELAGAIEASVLNKDYLVSTVEENYKLVFENYTWEKVASKYAEYVERNIVRNPKFF